jgi:hypothetical protein
MSAPDLPKDNPQHESSDSVAETVDRKSAIDSATAPVAIRPSTVRAVLLKWSLILIASAATIAWLGLLIWIGSTTVAHFFG